MAGKIKLDGTQFLEKVNNEFKITNSELKLKSTGNTIVDSSGNAVVSESGGNVTLGNVRLPATGGIKDSSGNNILTESGGNVSIGDLRLPTSGGIKDSSGNNVVSESGGVVTLAQDIVTGTSSYGFAQLRLTQNEALGNITWDTIAGDTTNFTKPSSNHLIQLAIPGIYLISASVTMVLTSSERNIRIDLVDNSGPTTLAVAGDEIAYVDGADSYGGATLTYTGYFPANSQIYFTTSSASGGNATVYSWSHASICLIRRTA